MRPPRPPRDDGSSPDSFSTPGGGGSSSDRIYDVSQRLSRLEASVAYLEAHADEARKKLDMISGQITKAEGSFNTAKYFLGAICLAVWGIVAMWAKHHFGW